MQVLGERITALITVIQSFAFFPVPRLNTAPLLSCRSVSKLPSDTSPGGFAPDSTVICDPDRGGKQKNGFRRTIGSSSRFTNSDVCRSLSVMGNICVWDGGGFMDGGGMNAPASTHRLTVPILPAYRQTEQCRLQMTVWSCSQILNVWQPLILSSDAKWVYR